MEESYFDLLRDIKVDVKRPDSTSVHNVKLGKTQIRVFGSDRSSGRGDVGCCMCACPSGILFK